MLRRWFAYVQILSLSSWNSQVLQSRVPVLVHFHADWSEKSTKQKLSLSSYHTSIKWDIAEVNMDSLPSLTSTLDIKSVPSLYLISKGKSLTKYTGEISGKPLISLINKIKVISGEWTSEHLVEYLINAAYENYDKKKVDEGIEYLEEALKVKDALEKFELTCWIGLCKMHYQREDFDSAEYYLDKTRGKYANAISGNSEIKLLFEKVLLAVGDKKAENKYEEYHAIIKGMNQDIFEDPYNNEKHAKLAITHYDFGFIEEGINKALQIIDAEGSLTGYGYKALMEIVNDLGPESQYVKDLQPRLKNIHLKYRA